MHETRASFFARISFLAPSERFLVRKAYDISKATHRKQLRKEIVDGAPVRYFEHPRSVAIILIDELRVVNPELIALALLHDVIEDADEFSDMSPEYIEYLFGETMTRRVLLLSKERPQGGTADKFRARSMYLARLRNNADVETLLVKACDRLHNLRTLCCDGTTMEFIAKQCTETRCDYLPLFEDAETRALDTPLHEPLKIVRSRIIGTLKLCEMDLAERQRTPDDSGPPPRADND